MPLSNAPTEIVSQIFSWLGTSDLANLCLVNKSFRDVVGYTLYSDITFKRDPDQNPRIVALLDTLFRKPELFDHITALTYVDVVQTLNPRLTYSWTDKLERGEMDAFAAILIAHLTQISHLTITGHNIDQENLIGRVLKLKISGQLPKFERLKFVTYFEGRARFNDVMRLFQIPTVTHLAGSMESFPRGAFKWLSDSAYFRNLTFLAIEGSSAANMGEILALPENLKSLAWSWEYATRTSNSSRAKNLDLDEIVTALSHVKDTLERLQLRITINTEKYYDGEEKINVMGSFSGLRDFNRITDLELPLVFLAGCGDNPQPLDHCTPGGIKTLSLSCVLLLNDAVKWNPSDDWLSDQGILALVSDMSNNSSTNLPQLQRINIFDVDNWFENWQLFEMLEETPLDVEVKVIRRVPQLWDF
ncbi:unnamed protein product [Clonostachys solani]|uniref:F-box domain-containing protein n=1 Tax=Clonostachys solani TaxID=160281 RepID=A0A9P0EEG1_9HYPO|nr:unnamed protein product [Clonostachys solani]